MVDLKNKPIYRQEIEERLNWFVQLRWLAVGGVFLVITSARFIFNMDLPYLPLYVGGLVLAGYNTYFYYKTKNLERKNEQNWNKERNKSAGIQMFLDILLLTYFIHFAGGLENPFIFYFIFHMVIAGIILSERQAYLQAALASFFVGAVAGMEYFNILPHHHLEGFIPAAFCMSDFTYVFVVTAVFISTLFITVYMTTTVVKKLRLRENELAAANKKLNEQDKIKSRYVMNVSHDLKSNLATVQNCLNVVLKNYTGNISEKAREMVTRAEKRVTYTLDYVKDLLDLSKMRTDEQKADEKVCLNDVVEKIVENYNTEAENKNIQIKFNNSETKILIHGNTKRWEQLVDNLLGNGIKYTDKGGKLTVELSKKFNKIILKVTDTGAGIPQDELPHIFDDFYRGKNAKESGKSGTGLGLSIVKEIVESYSGEIKVDSKKGMGTSFTITLPGRHSDE